MFFDLDIAEIANTFYHTPVSYLVFYYLILFSIISIVKNVMDINVEYLKAEFGIFKLDSNSVPALLFIGWFGFLFKFISYLDIFQDSKTLILGVASIFVVAIILLKVIKTLIQWLVYFILKGGNMVVKERRSGYVKEFSHTYNSIIINVLLVTFCVTFAIIEFEIFPAVFTIGIMSIYVLEVAYIKLPEFFRGLHGWN